VPALRVTPRPTRLIAASCTQSRSEQSRSILYELDVTAVDGTVGPELVEEGSQVDAGVGPLGAPLGIAQFVVFSGREALTRRTTRELSPSQSFGRLHDYGVLKLR
jgi:hypothetical protein